MISTCALVGPLEQKNSVGARAQLPQDSGMHAADSAFLLDLGLKPVPQRGGKRRRPGGDAHPRRWHQPWQLDALLLDVAALREALAAGTMTLISPD